MPCEGRCVEAYISGSQRPWLAVDAVLGVGSRVLGSTPQLCITELGEASRSTRQLCSISISREVEVLPSREPAVREHKRREVRRKWLRSAAGVAAILSGD